MITRDGYTINRETARHKFGGDPMAEYLHLLSMDGQEDDQTGDATEWNYWAARFGRRILTTDSQGFVSQYRYASEDEAKTDFAEMCDAYWRDSSENDYATGRAEIPETLSYSPYAVMDDGGVLCEHCVRDADNPVHDETSRGDSDRRADGWGVVGWGHSGDSDETVTCDHCNRVIVEGPPQSPVCADCGEPMYATSDGFYRHTGYANDRTPCGIVATDSPEWVAQ